jgi:hypothetical protein
MKKTKITLVSFSALLLPVLAFAQMQTNAPGGPGVAIGSMQQIIEKIEMAAGLIFGAIAVISFVIAGIYFLTSGGDPDKVTKARSAAIWGVAGIVVGIIAFSIIAIVASFLR